MNSKRFFAKTNQWRENILQDLNVQKHSKNTSAKVHGYLVGSYYFKWADRLSRKSYGLFGIYYSHASCNSTAQA